MSTPVTYDMGSRHSPDHYRGSVALPPAVPSDTARCEIAWLSSIIGCASPFAPAADASSVDGAIRAAASPLPAPTLVRVSLHDGRIYSGRLHCVDSASNLILSHARQLESTIDDVDVGGFALGQTLIGWNMIAKVEQLQSKTNATAQ
jgi:small nuclear ribonucleoprotein (snRNP)-like protein